MTQVIWIRFKEISEECGSPPRPLPALRDAMAPVPHEHEEKIAAYLEKAPTYCAMGKVVRDALDPTNGVLLYPGIKTDGLYLWPTELAYYVRRYHVRLPIDFTNRMASLNWQPPHKSSINFKDLYAAMASQDE